MKYDPSCVVFSTLFTYYLKIYYKNKFPDYDLKSKIKAIKKEYKAIIKRTPELSKDNNMKGNLKGAAYFFAVAKILDNMTPEIMDDFVYEMMSSDIMYKVSKKEREKGLLFSDKNQDKMAKDAIRSQSSNDVMDWKYTYEKGVDECKYTITKCGVCQLAKQENVLPYLPCMCHMDYPKYASKGATLIRSKTLADGDECCDFHLIRKKPEK